MSSCYLRTKMGTGFNKRASWIERLTRLLLPLIPRSNPGYKADLHWVSEWLVEFDEDGLPGREMGLDEQGQVVVAGPSNQNYGFWLDTNMTLSDFEGEPVDAELFESLWASHQDSQNQ